jgi:hypothetical protein
LLVARELLSLAGVVAGVTPAGSTTRFWTGSGCSEDNGDGTRWLETVQLLPDITENPGLIKKLADARMAIGRFAGLAFAAYRSAHADAFTLES